jgi:hypothetical protein
MTRWLPSTERRAVASCRRKPCETVAAEVAASATSAEGEDLGNGLMGTGSYCNLRAINDSEQW